MRALGKLGHAKDAMDAVAALRALLSHLLDAFVALVEPLAHRALARLGRQERCLAVLDGEALTLRRVRGRGAVETLGTLEPGATGPGGMRPGAVDLRLPAEHFLRRTLVLPDVGRGYLEPILAHRLERLTPWRPDRVRYGFRIEPGKTADGTITVELLATSAERVEPLTARLEAAGLSVASLGSAADPLDAPPRIDLVRERGRVGDARLRRAVSVCTAGALAVLVPACLLTGWLADAAESDLAATQDRLATLQRHIRAAKGEAGSRERTLIEAKRVETSTLTLLDGLSATLPDHTVLRELDIGPDKLRLVGRSGDAAALIGRLEGQAGLAAVRFAAPVTRDAERQDLFDIAANRPALPGRAPERAP